MLNDLTEKQKAFVQEYLIDLNATQAAIRAGYSPDTARQIACENLTKPDIAAAVAEAIAERSERTKITQEYVLHTVVETIEHCKQALPVLDRKGKPVMVETPDGEISPAYTFNANAVLNGAKMLGEHIGTFKQRLEVTGKDGNPIASETTHSVTTDLVKSIVQQVRDEF